MVPDTFSRPVSGVLLPVMRWRYEQLELRRITAMDVAGAGSRAPAPSH